MALPLQRDLITESIYCSSSTDGGDLTERGAVAPRLCSFMKLDMVRLGPDRMHPQGMLPQGMLPHRPASTKRRNKRNLDNEDDSCILQPLTGANMGQVSLARYLRFTSRVCMPKGFSVSMILISESGIARGTGLADGIVV